jgi:hypothetical protein
MSHQRNHHWLRKMPEQSRPGTPHRRRSRGRSLGRPNTADPEATGLKQVAGPPQSRGRSSQPVEHDMGQDLDQQRQPLRWGRLWQGVWSTCTVWIRIVATNKLKNNNNKFGGLFGAYQALLGGLRRWGQSVCYPGNNKHNATSCSQQ